jgi:hypothetical protein
LWGKNHDLLVSAPPIWCGDYFRILRSEMADLIFVVLTIAIFVIFGFVVKAVERL